MDTTEYIVRPGDTLSRIAQSLGVSLSDISGYASGDPNKIQVGERLTIGRPTPVSTGIISPPTHTAAPAAQSVVSTDSVNLSTVQEGVPVVSSPQEQTLPEIPQTPFVQTAQGEPDTLEGRMSQARSEIREIEQRMAEREAGRVEALDTTGVFDDLRRLDELNAQLREAQDRQIEIPLETRRALRGQAATRTEFAQMSRPQLEDAALRELSLSRAASRLADSISTNMAIIDQRIEAEKARDEVIYRQKNAYLDSLESNYASIINESQKIALEERKSANELALMTAKWELDTRKDAFSSLAGKGIDPSQYMSLSTEGLLALDWNTTNSTQTSKQQAIASSAIGMVDLVDNLLSNKKGLSTSVGVGLGRTTLPSIMDPRNLGILGLSKVQADANLFRNQLKNLVTKQSLEYLVSIKERGATFGALSDSERQFISDAAIGNLGVNAETGTSNLSEGDFKRQIQTFQMVAMKDYIATQMGRGFNPAAYRNATFNEIKAIYDSMKGDESTSYASELGI